MGPVVAAYEVEQSRERRIVIGYKQGGTKSFFSALSDLYHSYNFYSTRKYVGESLTFTVPSKNHDADELPYVSESFKNGITIITLYLSPLSGPPVEASILQIIKEASLMCEYDTPKITL